eukprot:g45582.t1
MAWPSLGWTESEQGRDLKNQGLIDGGQQAASLSGNNAHAQPALSSTPGSVSAALRPWSCPFCQFAENPPLFLTCRLCSRNRPALSLQKREWKCRECVCVNPERYLICKDCNKQRPPLSLH